jgi:PAS domain S-box-containing protein
MDTSTTSTLFDRLPIGAYQSSVDGRQLRANRALVRLNGYADEAQMLTAVNDIAAEWYVDSRRRAQFKQLIERDGHVVNFESEVYRHGTRERIWIRENAYAVRDDQGRVLYYEGTVEDITPARQARQTLEDSERRFRALTEQAQVLSVVCDPRGVVSYASPASRAMLGREPQDTEGTCLFDWLHPDDVALARVEIAEVVERRNSGVESINRVRHADGSWRLLASLGKNCLDEPAVRGIVLNFRDVTERERAAQALRLSQQKFEKAFAASPDALIISRLSDGVYLEVNDTFLRLSGYTRGELIGHSSVELHIWATAAERAAFVAALSKRGQVRDFEAPYHGRGGRHGVVSISAEIIDIEGEACVLAISRDITDSLETQRALRESEARLRLALQSTHQGLYDVDLETGEAIVSPDYARMLGHEPDAFHESIAAWMQRLHPDDQDRVTRAFRAYIAGEMPEFQVEFRQRTRSGEWTWILSLGRIVEPSLPGQHRRMLGTHTDITRRKQVEFDLLRQMQRLEAAESQAHLGSWEYDFMSGEGWLSTQMYALIGLDPDAGFPGLQGFVSRLHPHDRASAMQVLERGARGEPLTSSMIRTDPAQGPLRWLSLSVQQECNAAGPTAKYFGTMLDITSIKRAERALAHQVTRLERAETIAQMGSWEQDLATGTVWWSAQMRALAGSRPGEEPVSDLRHLHRDDRLLAMDTMDRAIASAAPQQVVVRSNPKRGPIRWFSASGQCERDDQGRPIRLSGTLIDVTALKHAEQALRELNDGLELRVAERTRQLADSERRYRTIFEAVPVAIMDEDWSETIALLKPLRQRELADPKAYFAAHPDLVLQCLNSTRIARMNPAALVLYGVQDKPEPLANLEQVFAQYGSRDGFIDEMVSLLAGERRHTATRPLHRADGTQREVLVTLAFPAPDEPDGTVLVSLSDITELKRLSAALDTSLKRVTRVNRELETFTYSVSHDLKAPLRGLDGYSQLLLRQYDAVLDDEGRAFLRNIRSATRQMGQLIDDLLAYSRLERRHQEPVSLSLSSLVARVLSSCADELDQRGIVPDVDLPEVAVRADSQGLTLALRNLLDNALKFTARTPEPRIAVGGYATDTGVVIWVRDNGLGFDMTMHDRIFEIFQRLQRAEDYPGTGVGLAIVRKAMERMGGRVWGRSVPGQGATFFLELPRG